MPKGDYLLYNGEYMQMVDSAFDAIDLRKAFIQMSQDVLNSKAAKSITSGEVARKYYKNNSSATSSVTWNKCKAVQNTNITFAENNFILNSTQAPAAVKIGSTIYIYVGPIDDKDSSEMAYMFIISIDGILLVKQSDPRHEPGTMSMHISMKKCMSDEHDVMSIPAGGKDSSFLFNYSDKNLSMMVPQYFSSVYKRTIPGYTSSQQPQTLDTMNILTSLFAGLIKEMPTSRQELIDKIISSPIYSSAKKIPDMGIETNVEIPSYQNIFKHDSARRVTEGSSNRYDDIRVDFGVGTPWTVITWMVIFIVIVCMIAAIYMMFGKGQMHSNEFY